MAALVGKTGYRTRHHPWQPLPAIRTYFSAILQGHRIRKDYIPINPVPGTYISLMGSDAYCAVSVGLQKPHSKIQQLLPLLLPTL